jgi:hypothetical protein
LPSSYGKRHGLPGYDKFRSGLTYRDVWEMMRDESEDPRDWKRKSRGVVLWHWHELKMQLYFQMMEVERNNNGAMAAETKQRTP